MEKILVCGGQVADGFVHISGAKNAALPLLAAGLLSDEELHLTGVPQLVDIRTMFELLQNLGVSYQEVTADATADITNANACDKSWRISADKIFNCVAPYEIVKKMRASILVLGPLLSRFGHCRVSLPGGCAIGVRPIDLHIKGLRAMGAEIDLYQGYVQAKAPNGLKGATVEFPTVTVTGTENIMMAATLASGITTIINAAKEPEIVDLADCLNKMGAEISGQGSERITVKGVSKLHGATHRVIADRIEAGTYALAAAITRGKIDLLGYDFRSILPTFIESMGQAGLIFTDIDGGLRVECSSKLSPVNIFTEPYPGYPTDLQAQAMAFLCTVNGSSNIYENIWENRFMHVPELCRMGANIEVSGAHAIINGGQQQMVGAQVMATDLRASFSLVLAGLVAKGETIVDRIYHLDRGYSCVEQKLASCGLKVQRVR